jgi:hypothetical protein
MHKIRNSYEEHSTVREWQVSGMVIAGERHGMFESAFTDTEVTLTLSAPRTFKI